MWDEGDPAYGKIIAKIGTEANIRENIDMTKSRTENIAVRSHLQEAEEMRIKIKAFEEMIEQKMTRDGWNGYLVSFMFHPVPGATTTKLDIMGEVSHSGGEEPPFDISIKPTSPFHRCP